MRTTWFGVIAGALVVAGASAQRLAAYDPISATIFELQPPTAMAPTVNLPLFGYPVVFAMPVPTSGLPTPGDSTFDNLRGMLWLTDGSKVLAAMPTPTVKPVVPVPPPIPIPPWLTEATGGPLTGIALDPVGVPERGPVMYVVGSEGMVVGVALEPGLRVLVRPFRVPLVTLPIVGLEWDGATGTLWAVDVCGIAFNFLPGGLAVAPPVVPVVPLPGPAGDIAIDKLGTVNAAGRRPLYVNGGPVVVDICDPVMVGFPAGACVEGLAWINHPAMIPPPVAGMPDCAGCPGITAGPTAFAIGPMTTGNADFFVGMGGLEPATGFGVFAFETAPGTWPLAPTGTCPLGLMNGAMMILVIGGPADAVGNVYLRIPLTELPVGLQAHNQNFTFCPTTTLGFALSPFQTITVGGL